MTTAVVKDNDGFLWVGTEYGLNRFDGYQFKLYNKEKNGLYSDKFIQDIKVDAAGNLWLYYEDRVQQNLHNGNGFNAIDIFNPKTGKAIPFQLFFKNNLPFDLVDTHLTHLIDPKKRIWTPTKKGELFLYEEGRFQKIFEQEGMFFEYITVDEQDNIWVGHDKTLLKINLAGEVEENIPLSGVLKGIWTGDNQQIWLNIAQEIQVKYIDKFVTHYTTEIWSKTETGDLLPFSFIKNGVPLEIKPINHLLTHRSQAGYWYLEIDHELHVFDDTGVFLYNYHDLLENIYTGYSHYFEERGELWLPTPVGLLKTAITKNPFKLIHSFSVFSDCRGITENREGNIFFRNKELYKWQPKAQKIEQIEGLDGGYNLTCADNLLWMGLARRPSMAFQLDLKTGKNHAYPAQNSNLAFATFELKKSGTFLVGTDKGIDLVTPKEKKYLRFTKYNEFDILETSEVYHFHENEAGIWIATNQGIFLMTREAGIIRHFSKDSGDLPFDYIRHFHEAENGDFWLATKGAGIIRWKPSLVEGKLSESQQFTSKEGLTNDYLYAVYEDDFGKLWMPSDEGLMCMDKQTLKIKTFLTEDGLPHNEFNFTAHYQAKNGTLYFGGLGGLISFHPSIFSDLPENNTPLVFTKFSLFEEGQKAIVDKTSQLKTTKKITLNPTDKFLELEFALLDFDHPKLHTYAYQIEGYSDQWNYINENQLRITSLPYGDYRLKIIGKNSSHGWSKQELTLDIEVQKPFYLEVWFIGLSILSLLGLTIGGVKWRLRNLQKDRERLEKEVEKRTATIQQQAQKLQALDKAKTRFFSNITHEFRTPLTLVIGPLEQVMERKLTEKSKGKLTSVLKNARHLLGLINQLLDLSKLESGQMKVEVTYGDINAYTRELVHSIKPLADKKEQTLQIAIAETAWKTQFDKKKWTKIIYNLLSNAIKYTPEKGTIQLELQSNGDGQIHLRVKDSGIGIKKSQLAQIFNRFYQVDDSSTRHQEGTGIGLALVKELVELQGGSIDVVSEHQKGTTFDIKLPVFEMSMVIETDILPIIGIEKVSQSQISEEKPLLVKTPIQSKQKEQLVILIIEDNAEMRRYIRDCLDERKYHITEASNGIEGIDKAIELVPDLIISDVMMPGKNGFEVTETLRSTMSTSHIPIILLTAKSALESRLAGFKSGADVYLTKPFSPQELSLRIQKLIEIRELIRSSVGKSTYKEIKEPYEKENHFIKGVRSIIEKHLTAIELNGEFIGQQMGMSRMQLHRKLKALINQTASDFIMGIRLQKAYELLQTQNYNSSEVAYQTGFNSPSYFSRTFKKKYGYTPSDLLKKEGVI